MLAAVLTVSGPGCPLDGGGGGGRCCSPSYRFISSSAPSYPRRSLLGLSVGWFLGALTVLLVGTPALEVPLAGAVRALERRRVAVCRMAVVRPAGPGPLILSAETDRAASANRGERSDGGNMVLELYGPNQRSGGALRQLWRKLSLRNDETAPLQTSMRRSVEHRGLMAIAVGDAGVANTDTVTVTTLDRGWMLYAHSPASGTAIDEQTPVGQVWKSLGVLHDHLIFHGDLRSREITVDDGKVLFGGFGNAEYGASAIQLQADVAQLLMTTSSIYGAGPAVTAAIETFGRDAVLAASSRLTKSAMPQRLRESLSDTKTVMSATRDEVKRQTGADQIHAETITRFTRYQLIQLVLLVALVYVAYPFISTVPAFFAELRTANWWWALLGLTVSALTYVGAAAALWACASETVSFRNLTIMQVANTFAATTTPAGVGGLALSTRFLQKSGLGALRATAAVALQQTVQVITHVALLIFFTVFAGASADLSHFRAVGHRALPGRGCSTGNRRCVHVRAEGTPLAGDGRPPAVEGGGRRPRHARP